MCISDFTVSSKWYKIINAIETHVRNYNDVSSVSLLWLANQSDPAELEVVEADVFVYLGVAPRLEILSL
jgi:hypothetical protein